MTTALRFVLSPGGLAVSILAGLVWKRLRPASPRPRRFLIAMGLGYWLTATYAVEFLLGRAWLAGTHPFSAADVPSSGTVAEVVLGSGSYTARNWDGDRFSVADPAGAMRVIEAVRVYRLAHPSWVISSGGLITGRDGEGSSGAITMRDALVKLGVPADRIILETRSKNTRDEAVFIEPMLKSLSVDHVILVTSELHIRRSLGVFRAVGIQALPAKARGVFTALPWYLWIFPSTEGFDEAGLLYHEALGIPYYRLRGWYQ